MTVFIYKFVLFVTFFEICLSKKLPSFITPCRRSDPNLKQCCLEVVKQLQIHMIDGIPELLIPPMNPLRLPEVTLENGPSFRATFRNIEIYHAHNFAINHLNIDVDNDHVEASVSFPKLRIKSVYNINGKLLILNLNGQGNADGNFTNVSANLVIDGKRYMKKGKTFVNMDRKFLDIKLGRPVFRFDNLFHNNPELNEQTNMVINENIEDIIEEMQPIIDKTVVKFVFLIVDRIFNRFALDELLPK